MRLQRSQTSETFYPKGGAKEPPQQQIHRPTEAVFLQRMVAQLADLGRWLAVRG